MYGTYLVHHGIKGQKWGIRRYQNEDGTWTEEGKIRYGVGDDGKMNQAGRRLYDQGRKGKTSSSGQSKSEASPEETKKKGLTGTQKALIAIGATAATAAVVYGLVKYGKYAKDKVIKEGDTINRVAAETKLYDTFYASKGEHDRIRYEGLLPQHIKANYGQDVAYSNKIRVNKDIKVASNKKAKQVFKQLKKEGVIGKEYLTYNQYNRAIPAERQMNPNGLKEFYKRLSDKGYGAIQDVNDKKYSKYYARNPMIFFGDSVNRVKITSSTKLANDETKYAKEMGKIWARYSLESAGKLAAVPVGVAAASSYTRAVKEAFRKPKEKTQKAV